MCQKTEGILLAHLLQRSRSTFSWGSFLSFFAFKEDIFDHSNFGPWGLANSIRRVSEAN
jgi:hypothetical protein